MAEPPSSPPPEVATLEESLAWYKKQYDQLVDELADFRDSSAELEAELEKDLEAADKKQRDLQQKAETLQFEADEWKEKCRKAKADANAAQNALEKEVTTLRDSNLTLQLKLRDIEVANDDFERQARNTTSTLEDMESKYNVAIERTVMMEEEIKIGEQERETLRIEAQRLREELSDLKVEAEIMQDKIKKAEDRHLDSISTDITIPDLPSYNNSPRSTASSPMITTPPGELSLLPHKGTPESREPPSPPMSDTSHPLQKPTPKLKAAAPSTQKKSRLPSAEHSVTPRPRRATASNIRPPSTGRVRSATTSRTPAPTPARTTTKRVTSQKVPPSNSLTQVRNLAAQAQRLEARLHSARSKLPGPVQTPPRASPRASSPRSAALGGQVVPPTVTMRTRKRTIGSTTSSVTGDEPSSTPATGRHAPRLSVSGVSRLSFGPLPNRTGHYDPDNSSISMSRPSSRASISSGFAKPERPVSRGDMARPVSRASYSSSRTPLRPRSSFGSNYHGHSQSTGYADGDEYEERTPSRRGTYSKYDTDGSGSGIPTPTGIPVPRRMSGGMPAIRRTSSGMGGEVGGARSRKLSDLGETY